MIGDHYNEKWQQKYPNIVDSTTNVFRSPVNREEFDELKRDVTEMKSLLKRAKIYDEEHGEPDCQMEEKIALLKKMAELVGVDLEDVL
jgi:hypothetical protein